jgi:anaphase-promoting complex subunit 11
MESSTEYYELGKHSEVSVGVCGHAFHNECINKWLQKSIDCPICREKWIFKKND